METIRHDNYFSMSWERVFYSFMLIAGTGLAGVAHSQQSPVQRVALASTIPPDTATLPHPNAKLTPADVVRIQVEALRDNDEKDRGIWVAYNFASPGNRAYIGEMSEFADLVRSKSYAPMLHFRSYLASHVKTTGDEARQIVILVDAEGNEAAYLFVLVRQQGGACNGCWLTDGVIRLERTSPLLRT